MLSCRRKVSLNFLILLLTRVVWFVNSESTVKKEVICVANSQLERHSNHMSYILYYIIKRKFLIFNWNMVVTMCQVLTVASWTRVILLLYVMKSGLCPCWGKKVLTMFLYAVWNCSWCNYIRMDGLLSFERIHVWFCHLCAWPVVEARWCDVSVCCKLC